MILTRKHQHWREGQTIFNFLEWLRVEKGWEREGLNGRMADPFAASDEDLNRFYDEFLSELVERSGIQPIGGGNA